MNIQSYREQFLSFQLTVKWLTTCRCLAARSAPSWNCNHFNFMWHRHGHKGTSAPWLHLDGRASFVACHQRLSSQHVWCSPGATYHMNEWVTEWIRRLLAVFPFFFFFKICFICVQPPRRHRARKNLFNRLSQAVDEKRKEGHKVDSSKAECLLSLWHVCVRSCHPDSCP